MVDILFICPHCRSFGIFDVSEDVMETYCIFCRLSLMKKIGFCGELPFVVRSNNQ